ncbi:MAG: GntR family transcriptional regulator [Acholeplasmataceae bacterium]
MTRSKVDLFVRIKRQFQTLIEKGAYLEGEFLPSVRKTSLDLGVNPNTVQKAYQALADDGYIDIVPKKGAYVKKVIKHPEKVLIDEIKARINDLKKHYSSDDILRMIINHLEGESHD